MDFIFSFTNLRFFIWIHIVFSGNFGTICIWFFVLVFSFGIDLGCCVWDLYFWDLGLWFLGIFLCFLSADFYVFFSFSQLQRDFRGSRYCVSFRGSQKLIFGVPVLFRPKKCLFLRSRKILSIITRLLQYKKSFHGPIVE